MSNLRIDRVVWDQVLTHLSKLPPGALSWPPVVFAMYGDEADHLHIISCREITTVKAKGDRGYRYPGIKDCGFYPERGTGIWFTGTLVAGDGLELNHDDRHWMIRDEMDFRVKLDRSGEREWDWRAYVVEVNETTLHLLGQIKA